MLSASFAARTLARRMLASRTPLVSLESKLGRRVRRVAFSCRSNVLRERSEASSAGRIPHTADANARHPLVISSRRRGDVRQSGTAGPICRFIAAGREVLVPSLDRAFREASTGRICGAARATGVLRPSFYEPQYESGSRLSVRR